MMNWTFLRGKLHVTLDTWGQRGIHKQVCMALVHFANSRKNIVAAHTSDKLIFTPTEVIICQPTYLSIDLESRQREVVGLSRGVWARHLQSDVPPTLGVFWRSQRPRGCCPCSTTPENNTDAAIIKVGTVDASVRHTVQLYPKATVQKVSSASIVVLCI